HASSFKRPRRAHPGDANSMSGMRCPDEIPSTVAGMLKYRSIDGVIIVFRIEQPAFVVIRPQRVRAFTLQHMHAVRCIHLRSRHGRVEKIPSVADPMKFRRPDPVRSGWITIAPDHDRPCILD